MDFKEEDAKSLTASFEKIGRDLANLHRDVSAISRKILPKQESEKPFGRWPPVKSFADVRTALAWLAQGIEGMQGDVGRMNARLDVVMNDSHAFDEMKKFLTRPPPDRRRNDR